MQTQQHLPTSIQKVPEHKGNQEAHCWSTKTITLWTHIWPISAVIYTCQLNFHNQFKLLSLINKTNSKEKKKRERDRERKKELSEIPASASANWIQTHHKTNKIQPNKWKKETESTSRWAIKSQTKQRKTEKDQEPPKRRLPRAISPLPENPSLLLFLLPTQSDDKTRSRHRSDRQGDWWVD